MKHFFIFKKLTFVILAVFFHSAGFAQPRHKQQPAPAPVEAGSLNYLLACNGFKQLKLGADIKNLEMDKLAYLDDIDSLDADSCYKLVYQDDDMLNMGNGIYLNLVGFRIYKNKIVNIYLFFDRYRGYDVLQEFEAEYGNFTKASGEFMYDWKTDKVNLSLRYKPIADMGVAIFSCNQMVQQVARDDVKRNELRQQEQTRDLAEAKDLLGAL
jgi:hypothetical protein